MAVDYTEKWFREFIDSKAELRQRMQSYERFNGELERIRDRYAGSGKPEELAAYVMANRGHYR